MAQTPEAIERAAHLAAERVKAMLVAMLAAGELGEVTVQVDYYGLKPVKHVLTEGRTIKVTRAHSIIESVR